MEKQQNVNQLPKDWKVKKLGDIGITSNTSIIPAKYPEEIFELWSVPNFDLNEPEYVRGQEIGSNKCLVKENDVLLCKINPRINRVWKVAKKKKHRQIASTEWIVIRNEEINADFLVYQLSAQTIRKEILKDVSGVGGSLMRARPNAVKALQIAVPPKPTQQAVVSKIEELFSEIDKGIENLRTAQQQLKTYRQSVLKWAFEGKLTQQWRREKTGVRFPSAPHELTIAAEWEVEYKTQNNSDRGILPEGWKWQKLSHIGGWKGGGTPSKKNKAFWEKGNILWVSPKDMKSKVIHDTIDKITSDAIENSSTKLISKGSILFVVRSGILRRTLPVAITICDVTVNQDLQAFTPKEVSPDYVYWYVQAKNEDIRRDCSKDGTTVESIESSLLKNYLIPICSDIEQNKIIQEIESRLSVADKMEESIIQSLQQGEALRQSILKKAFEGRLV